MIDRDHPAVAAAHRAVKRAYGSHGGEALNYHATALRAALPHLAADDLRDTPAGRALMAEAWERGLDRGYSDGVEEAENMPPNPYRTETPDD